MRAATDGRADQDGGEVVPRGLVRDPLHRDPVARRRPRFSAVESIHANGARKAMREDPQRDAPQPRCPACVDRVTSVMEGPPSLRAPGQQRQGAVRRRTSPCRSPTRSRTGRTGSPFGTCSRSIVVVASPGPPAVISAISPKPCDAPMISVTSRKIVVGSNDGQVITRNFAQALGAVDVGRFVQLLRRVLQGGQVDQRAVADTAPHRHHDQRGQRPVRRREPRRASCRPNASSNWLTRPDFGFISISQVMPIATTLTMYGRKKIARSTARPGQRPVERDPERQSQYDGERHADTRRTPASGRPLCQKPGSRAIATKLSRPLK